MIYVICFLSGIVLACVAIIELLKHSAKLIQKRNKTKVYSHNLWYLR